jgi:1,4-alpha-glucan branching enzyme
MLFPDCKWPAKACPIGRNNFNKQTKKFIMQPRYIRSGPLNRPASASAAASERPVEKLTEKPVRKPAEKRVEKAAQKPVQRSVEFRLNLPGAKSATVAGTFNGWDSSRTPLAKDPNGGWKTTILLAPGRYEYRFVIDGAQWYSDPGAKECVPNSFGSTNSVVVV